MMMNSELTFLSPPCTDRHTMLSATRPFLKAPSVSAFSRALLSSPSTKHISTSAPLSSYRSRQEREAAEFFKLPSTTTYRSRSFDDDETDYSFSAPRRGGGRSPPSSMTRHHGKRSDPLDDPSYFDVDEPDSASLPSSASSSKTTADTTTERPMNRKSRRLELDEMARRIEDRATKELAARGITPKSSPDYLDLLEEQMRHEWRAGRAAGAPRSPRPIPFAKRPQWEKEAMRQRQLFPKGLSVVAKIYMETEHLLVYHEHRLGPAQETTSQSHGRDPRPAHPRPIRLDDSPACADVQSQPRGHPTDPQEQMETQQVGRGLGGAGGTQQDRESSPHSPAGVESAPAGRDARRTGFAESVGARRGARSRR
jgi:hypothetical protein